MNKYPINWLTHVAVRLAGLLMHVVIALFCCSCHPMKADNPLLKYSPADFYEGAALQAAKAIRADDMPALAAALKTRPDVAKSKGLKHLPLLAWAVGHENKAAFDLLLKAGAPVDDFMLVNDARMSMLTLATGATEPHYFNALLAHKANPNGLPESEPPLFTAFYSHKDDRFDQLLQAGADINHADETGKTILITVCIARDYQRALRLVKQGANVKVEMKNGTNLEKIIGKFPLPPASEQGKAQQELKALL